MRSRPLVWLLSLFVLVACESTSAASPPPARLDWASPQHDGALPPKLTGTDGAGLALVSLEAQVVVQAPLAFTELRMRFRNPEARVREGNFEITLPESAALSRFAMKVGDHFQEGEVVERKEAQRVYEDFLHRRQDPALLEHDAGNRFRARVFPIGANEDKEIILSYSEELNQKGDHYRLYLSGLPVLPTLKVRVLANDGEHKVEQDNAAPRGDLVLSGGPGVLADLAVRAGDVYLVRTKPTLDATPAKIESLTLLFDTSASGTLGFDARVERVLSVTQSWAKELKRDFEVRLVAFDQTVKPLYQGPASRLRDDGLRALRKRSSLGASNLEAALTALSKQKLGDRMLLVSDAVVTAGEADQKRLTDAVAKLKAQGLARLDVMLTGGIHDDDLARSLVSAKLPHVGAVLRESDSEAELLASLVRQPLSNVPVQLTGASWWWPRSVASLLPGDYVTVLATLKGKEAPELRVGDQKAVRPVPLEVAEPLLRRAWARARLRELEAELATLEQDDVARRTKLESELTSLSMRHRVLTSRTALLVLETENDYARYNISRQSLSDILAVGPRGIRVLSGAQRAQQIATAEVAARREVAKKREAVERQRDRQMSPRDSDVNLAMRPRGAAPEAESLLLGEPMAEPAAPPPGGSLADVLAGGAVTGNAEEVVAQAARAGASRSASAASPARASEDAREVITEMRPMPRGVAEGAALAEMRGPRGMVRMQTPLRRLTGTRDVEEVQKEFKKRLRAMQICYEQQLRRNPELRATLPFHVEIAAEGTTQISVDAQNQDPGVAACLRDMVRRFRFSKQDTVSTFTAVATFDVDNRPPATTPVVVARRVPPARVVERPRNPMVEGEDPPKLTLDQALEGPLLSVMTELAAGNVQGALEDAWRFRADDPGSVLALLGLGKALEASGNMEDAARAFGSIIDLFPSRTDLRRTAGNYLESLGEIAAQEVALDSYEKARAQRPDHPNSHRLYAYALLKAGRHAEAFQVLREGYVRRYPGGRFAGANEILGEDLRIAGNAWKRADPKAHAQIEKVLTEHNLKLDTTPSLRFILSWETDANDVDFHIYDGKRGHAYYQRKELASGGQLLADVTTGYGPERFRIDRPKAYPYTLVAHYYARGPMGLGMGKVQVVYHDGSGSLSFEERPFVIMKDRASVGLGVIRGSEAYLGKAVAKAK